MEFFFNTCLYTVIDKNYTLDSTQKILLMAALMLASALIAYLCGSANSAVIISRLMYHEDIRKKGSGNAGATNMLRCYGKLAAALTLLGDMLKCAVAVIIGALLWIDGAYIAGVFCVLGHVFPCWHGFRGGKGVAVTAMVVAMTSPVVFLVLILVFAIVLVGTKFVSLASIMAALLYPVFMSSWNSIVGNEGSLNVFMAFLQTAIILIMHRDNIKRLMNNTEPKISFHRKAKDGGEPSDTQTPAADNEGGKGQNGAVDEKSTERAQSGAVSGGESENRQAARPKGSGNNKKKGKKGKK